MLIKPSIANYFFCLQVLVSLINYASCDSKHSNETCPIKMSKCAASVKNAFQRFPSFADKRTPDFIQMFGYPLEIHEVVTEDGYILTLHRIPHSKRSVPSRGKIPVFCMHGGALSSAMWFWQPVRRALVFMLADAGYDVWLGNARGTSYSQKHISLPPNDPNDLRYWDFSIHEMGKFDVPAVINYITNHTAQPSLHWIGFSLGATQFLAGMSLHPELKSKVRSMFALAPAIFVGNLTNPFMRMFSPLYVQAEFQKQANVAGGGKFGPFGLSEIVTELAGICRSTWVDCGLCDNLIHLLFDFTSCQMNFKTLPILLAHVPDVISTKTQAHHSQLMDSGLFREFDHGTTALNLEMYGRPTPPDYNLSRVDVPIMMFHSSSDNIVVPKDVQKTVRALGSSVKEVIRIPDSADFGHMDFIAGIDTDKFIYKKIIDTMNSNKHNQV